MEKDLNLTVIACGMMKDELAALNSPGVRLEFLETGLHRTPDKMPPAIQEKINQVDGSSDYVVLGYGLCGNGIIGVKAGKQPLVIPKAHDCISLLLGSLGTYRREQKKAPGTVYLTKGWIEEGKPPLVAFEEYVQRLGREKAEWGIRMEYEHYTRVVLVDTGAFDMAFYRNQARANAAFLGLAYNEIKGSPAFFEKMVAGQWSEDEFVILPPGEQVNQSVVTSNWLTSA